MEYTIKSNKISKDIKICYISDIHSDIDKFKSILEEITNSKVNILLIGGDLLNSNKDNFEKNIIRELLKDYSKKIDIYVGLGNHELVYYKRLKEFKLNDAKYWEEFKDIKVSEYPSKKATFNKWTLKDIDISTLNLPIEYYWDKERKEDLKEHLKLLDKVNPNKYNILLLHSPINIIENKKEIDELKQYDLILCGHMHAGLVSKRFRKKIGGGLVAPYNRLFPKYSYGLMKDEKTTVLISGGVSKFSETTMPSKRFRDFLYRIYPPEIEILNFTKE